MFIPLAVLSLMIPFDVDIIDVQDSVQGALYKVRFGRYENLTEIDSVIKIYKNE